MQQSKLKSDKEYNNLTLFGILLSTHSNKISEPTFALVYDLHYIYI